MSLPDQLRSAYHRTTFEAVTPGGTISIRCGDQPAALDKLLSNHGVSTWAYITACNPCSRQLTAAENAERQSALVRLLGPRFRLYHGQGVGDGGEWPPEPSVLVIGIGREEAAAVGRNFGQYAVVVGEQGAPAELIDCWGLWPVSMPRSAAEYAGTSDEEDEGWCRCPSCGAMYQTAYQAPCAHLITDWCFTAEVEPGDPRGYWAGEDGGKLLAEFEAAVGELEALLDDERWPDRQSREAVVKQLPARLRPGRKRYGSVPKLLAERIAAAPGYLGSNTVQTDSMASDEWEVSWARDGASAAAHVAALFREDLTPVRAATQHAQAILGTDNSK